MKHRPRRPASRPTIGFTARWLVCAIGLLATLRAQGEMTAPSLGESARWRGTTVLQLGARADYAGNQGQARRRDAIVFSTHLRFASPTRPVTAGLLAEYRLVDERAHTLLIAGMFTYEKPKWTVAASPYYRRTERSSTGDWSYWATLRRHIADRHSLGVEIFGALDTGRPEKWTLGYYGNLTKTLSVSVTAGSGFRAGPDWVAGTSVVWRTRLSRH